MNLAIVTNQNPHHKFFVYSLYHKYKVKLIIHPTGKKSGWLYRIQSKKLFYYGTFWSILKILSLLFNAISGTSMTRMLKKAEKEYFNSYVDKYNQIPDNIIYKVTTVNDDTVVDLVKENDIDIICFLGGDIAQSEFINAAKICSLNYHSGTSPIYNGNKTIFHAVKDFRPNFAGGTLMYITERIDGGGILSHFLPEIRNEDKAVDLFMKGIYGAVALYSHFFNYLGNHEKPEGVIQERSFKFTRNIDWTFPDDIKLRRFERSDRMKIYSRKETAIYYYDLSKKDIGQLYKRALETILGRRGS